MASVDFAETSARKHGTILDVGGGIQTPSGFSVGYKEEWTEISRFI